MDLGGGGSHRRCPYRHDCCRQIWPPPSPLDLEGEGRPAQRGERERPARRREARQGKPARRGNAVVVGAEESATTARLVCERERETEEQRRGWCEWGKERD